jgi:hypothetical protein
MIRIWKFEDAPRRFQQLQPAGERIEWVMSVPADLRGELELLLLAAEQRKDVMFRQELEDGSLVMFGRSAQPDERTALESDQPRKQQHS